MKSKKGLASVSPEKRRQISAMGGKAAHALNRAHQWTSEEAAKAGRIGGMKSRRGPAKKTKDHTA
jgi:general stress protein YciG